MDSRKILAAALRWHSAHLTRMEATTASNRFKSERKKRTGFGGADCGLSARVTAAKRVELAALRELAKVCAKVRSSQTQVDDAHQVIDVDVKLLTGTTESCARGHHRGRALPWGRQ